MTHVMDRRLRLLRWMKEHAGLHHEADLISIPEMQWSSNANIEYKFKQLRLHLRRARAAGLVQIDASGYCWRYLEKSSDTTKCVQDVYLENKQLRSERDDVKKILTIGLENWRGNGWQIPKDIARQALIVLGVSLSEQPT